MDSLGTSSNSRFSCHRYGNICISLYLLSLGKSQEKRKTTKASLIGGNVVNDKWVSLSSALEKILLLSELLCKASDGFKSRLSGLRQRAAISSR